MPKTVPVELEFQLSNSSSQTARTRVQILLFIEEDIAIKEKLFMIDLHAHILPGVDDGAKTMEQSLFMVKQGEKAGITKICATPHILQQVSFEFEEKIHRSFELLKRKAAEVGSKIELLLGSEIHLCQDLNSLKKFDFFTLNDTGKYLLVELPWGQFPPYVDQTVFELQLEGRIPIIAHPERSIIAKRQLTDVENLVRKGALIQINAGSLLGSFGRKTKKLAQDLLKQNLVHFIASDAHDHFSSSIEILPQALTCAAKIIGREKAEKLVTENPQQVIYGEKLTSSQKLLSYENEQEETYNLLKL